MPLVGLIDRQGRKLKWHDIACGKGDFEDPLPLLLALYSERDRYCDYSVTELLNDPYFVQMRKRVDYYEKPDDIGDRLLGIGLHALLEKKAELIDTKKVSMLSENKMQYSVTVKVKGKKIGVAVGGTCDLILPTAIWDYKTVTMGKLVRLAKGQAEDGLEDWKWQLNFYRFMYHEKTGKDIKTLAIRAVVKDWRFYEFRSKEFDIKAYPRGLIIPLDVVPLDKVREHLHNLVKRHVTAERFLSKDLHRVGECDTWGGIRCEHYCPFGVSGACYFRKKDNKVKQFGGQNRGQHNTKNWPRPQSKIKKGS